VVEFSYNNGYQDSLRMSLFEELSGRIGLKDQLYSGKIVREPRQ